MQSRVRRWIHFVLWFIVRLQNFPCHLVHTDFVGCVSEIENRASRSCKPRSGLLSFYRQPRRCREAQVRLLDTVYKANRIEITNKMRPFVEFIPVFLNCPTCFEQHTAHHQELKNCNCSLWFYIRLWLPAAVMAQT
jgi:hypothetical protein